MKRITLKKPREGYTIVYDYYEFNSGPVHIYKKFYYNNTNKTISVYEFNMPKRIAKKLFGCER